MLNAEVEHFTPQHDSRDLTDTGDSLQRIASQKNNIGNTPVAEDADGVTYTQKTRRRSRRGSESGSGCESRQYEKFEFTV